MLGLRAQDSVTVCDGGDECCDNVTCGLKEGDCDSHEDCVGHLRCGNDNCDGPGFDSTDDCCYEDPLFPPPPPKVFSKEDLEKCEIAEDLEKKIAQAAVAQGCDLPKGRPETLSLNECAQVSCSADLMGKSFTCNNQNKERTCKGLLSLHDAMVMKTATQCSTLNATQVLRTTTSTCISANWCAYGHDCKSRVGTSGTEDCSGSGKCGWCYYDSDKSAWGCATSGTSNCIPKVTSITESDITSDLSSIPACLVHGNSFSSSAMVRRHAGNSIFICKSSTKLIITYDTVNSDATPVILAAWLLKAKDTISDHANKVILTDCPGSGTTCASTCFSNYPASLSTTGCSSHMKACEAAYNSLNAQTCTVQTGKSNCLNDYVFATSGATNIWLGVSSTSSSGK